MQAEFEEAGYQIVAITRDVPEKARGTHKRLELSFPIYSDPGLEVTAAFGVAWQADDTGLLKFLAKASGTDHNRLPVPAVFLVNGDGEIHFSYVNPNYKERPDTSVLLAAARTAM